MKVVTIEYCQALETKLGWIPGAQVKSFHGRRGSFEVSVDGELIYSKLKSGQFPDPAQVLAKAKQMMME